MSTEAEKEFQKKWQAEMKRRMDSGQDPMVALREMNEIEAQKHAASLPPVPFKKQLGKTIFFGVGIISYIWNIVVVAGDFGLFGLLIALFCGPLTCALAPWYAGFVHGNWALLLFTYIGGFVGGTLMSSE